MITVRTQIKEILHEANLGVQNMSADFMESLDQEVRKLVVRAVQRAHENGRRTVMKKDL